MRFDRPFAVKKYLFHLISGLTHADSGEILLRARTCASFRQRNGPTCVRHRSAMCCRGQPATTYRAGKYSPAAPPVRGIPLIWEKAGNAAAGGIWRSDGAGLSDQPSGGERRRVAVAERWSISRSWSSPTSRPAIDENTAPIMEISKSGGFRQGGACQHPRPSCLRPNMVHYKMNKGVMQKV